MLPVMGGLFAEAALTR
ncbi:hypothetical protein I5R25_01230 [Serratia marcescens]|nr:hypothetical protein [Serratia marcescens]